MTKKEIREAQDMDPMYVPADQEPPWTGRNRMETPKRPAMLGEVVPIYDHTTSEKPDRIRVSFDNGTTAIYVLDVEQPHPMCVESIRIIRKWNGYNNQPMRRRRKP